MIFCNRKVKLGILNDIIDWVANKIRNLIYNSFYYNGYSKNSKTEELLGCSFGAVSSVLVNNKGYHLSHYKHMSHHCTINLDAVTSLLTADAVNQNVTGHELIQHKICALTFSFQLMHFHGENDVLIHGTLASFRGSFLAVAFA